jgi:hypothetical protein
MITLSLGFPVLDEILTSFRTVFIPINENSRVYLPPPTILLVIKYLPSWLVVTAMFASAILTVTSASGCLPAQAVTTPLMLWAFDVTGTKKRRHAIENIILE